MPLGQRDVGQFVIKRARQLGLEPVAHREPRRWAMWGLDHAQRVVGAGNDRVAAVERKADATFVARPFHRHRKRAKRGCLDEDRQFLGGGDEDMAAIGLAPQHGREQADHRLAPDRVPLVIPRAVARNAHLAVAAVIRVPAFDRGVRAVGDTRRKLVERLAGEIDRGVRFRHRSGFRAATSSLRERRSKRVFCRAGLLRRFAPRKDAIWMMLHAPRS